MPALGRRARVPASTRPLAGPAALLVACLVSAASGAAALGPGADPSTPDPLATWPTTPAAALHAAAVILGHDPERIEALAVPTAPSPTLDAAYLRLTGSLGLAPTSWTPDTAWPPALDAPLASLVDAVADAVILQRAATAGMDTADRAAWDALARAYLESRALDDRGLLAAAVASHGTLPAGLDAEAVVAGALRLVRAGTEAAPDLLAPSLSTVVGCVTDPLALVTVCGTSDDVVTGDRLLVVDLGGNDQHLGNAGGSGIGILWGGTNGLPAALSLDIGGNDFYHAGAMAQGAGSTTPGILMDLDGHDTYLSDTLSFNFVQGAGNLGGVGLLYDAAGDDAYLTREGRVNGQTSWDSQGFGILNGIGIHHDAIGNDWTLGGAMSAGVGDFQALGWLLDLDGQDRRDAVRWSQGFADGGGVGLVTDASGHDGYVLEERRGQGASVAGHGVLLDLAGDDFYAAAGEAQGWSIGGVLWKPVNDILALLGVTAPGTGVLYDASGKDHYSGAGCNLCLWLGGDTGTGIDSL